MRKKNTLASLGAASSRLAIDLRKSFNTRSPLLSVGQDAALCPMAKLLLTLPGVEKVTVARYQVTVHRAALFTWDEVTASVMEVLAPFVQPTTEGFMRPDKRKVPRIKAQAKA